PLAGHIEPSKATCRIRPTTKANLMVTPPIFCAGYSANRGATARAHLPPKYPSCRGVTQDFAKSFSAQHGLPKYLSKRTANIGKLTKGLNGISLTMLGMRHSFCRKRSANGPRSPSMSAYDPKRTLLPSEIPLTLKVISAGASRWPKTASIEDLRRFLQATLLVTAD